ncbi:flavin reductase family protein [Corticibacter populi]|uniref:Flavin reductase family protein n=1 Tax=Corticibacter populi TaxID=1550736 RepID=A0A3M6QRK4_9BURK|nr:flavin reductase family protein [Corticibacter populi]RMX05677.1 flavin reductase family protein [Corticibacter populi]RZS31037.1 flavin reductase (DIM6/NTAB) family NADH-FMN oxidoreductase RutF [Corticibacter populi]
MHYRTDEPLPFERDPFSAIVSPRPIAWISTRGRDGRENLAPYSFFNAVAYDPPQIVVASVGRKPDREQGKDTLSLARESGVFCVNIAGYEDREALNQSSAPYPQATDEAALLGLATAPCHAIECSRLLHAPASLECRLLNVIELEGPSNFLMLARVEVVHLRDECLTPEGRFDVCRYRPLTRLGYQDFASIDQVFTMKRPKA